jgi:hypothetical protein
MKTFLVENARGNLRVYFDTVGEAMTCASHLADCGQNVMVLEHHNADVSCVMVYLGA